MKRNLSILAALLWFAGICLAACSSGSGGGTGGTGIISRGAISEYGSIFVNGTEFDTSAADVIVDGVHKGTGDAAVMEHLNIGKVVTVSGVATDSDENALADQVVYRNDVEGPVNAITPVNSETLEIEVLGQTVVINTVTRLSGITVDTLALNNMVEVSGFYDDIGTIWATFVEKTGVFDSSVQVEVAGIVRNLNTIQKTFDINKLTVHYASADMDGLPEGVPVEGLLVEVGGTLNAGGELAAEQILTADALEFEEADQIEVMGFVTGFTSIYQFLIGNQRIHVETNAEVVDGTMADITAGVKLEVEGTLVNGILYAWEIEFWEPGQIEVEGIVTDVVSATQFYVRNQMVVTHASTVYVDGLSKDIQKGILIEIKGRLVQGILYADKVSFE